ncbi:MAG: 4-hydroxy-tetrahydrodipicolinate synthase [Kofleriaceae bacterium]|nr:4-hydroxy-tetrahydrodipicolinate synthase [Kofleriaceae bacterium]
MKLQGAMTAIVTPMKDDAPDFDALEALLEAQISAGIHAIVAVGTTGESATLSVPEHLSVIEATVRIAAGRVPVVAGAGGNSTREAVALSQASAKVGADALLQVTPYYNKPTQEGLYQHFSAIAAATDLPIVLYNVPGRTSCDMHVETVARLAESDKFVAIKDATGDMRRASEILTLCGDSIDLLSGDDFTAFPLLALGGKGTISVVSNIVPDRVVKMCNAAEKGDWVKARKHHYSYQALASLLFVESNPIPVKAAMEILGTIGPEIRLPLVPASDATRALLRKQLTSEGML